MAEKGKTANQLIITPLLNAPHELVFEVWTDQKNMAQWRGPSGFTSTIHEMNVKPGGVWRFVMHGHDGVDYKNEIIFTKVVNPEPLSYSHVSGLKYDMTVSFENPSGMAKLTMHTLFESMAEDDKAVKIFGAIEGAKQTFNRLEEYLTKAEKAIK